MFTMTMFQQTLPMIVQPDGILEDPNTALLRPSDMFPPIATRMEHNNAYDWIDGGMSSQAHVEHEESSMHEWLEKGMDTDREGGGNMMLHNNTAHNN